jgi:hypothetical protein
LEGVIESLDCDIVHVKPSQAETVQNIAALSLPEAALPPSDQVVVETCDTEKAIDSECQKLLDLANRSDTAIPVGFDIEWVNRSGKSRSFGHSARLGTKPIPVALVQISYGDVVLLLRTYTITAETFPAKLAEVMKIGKQVGGDLTRMKHYGITDCPNQLEIITFCYNKNIISSGNIGLAEYCA